MVHDWPAPSNAPHVLLCILAASEIARKQVAKRAAGAQEREHYEPEKDLSLLVIQLGASSVAPDLWREVSRDWNGRDLQSANFA
jgi:hypothetical protein